MTKIWCIGSALWDVIGRTDKTMTQGADQPGRITRLPGGVALNIAMTLARFGVKPGLLSVVGRDAEGEALLTACAEMGVDCTHVLRHPSLPTDRYMAIEDPTGLIAALADAHTLEAAGDDILAPLTDGQLGSAAHPFEGGIVVDGNLTDVVLTKIATHSAFSAADLRIAPASPGKALRLGSFVENSRGTLYVNLEEAGLLCNATFPTSSDAARALINAGAHRAIVTNGAEEASEATSGTCLTALPPQVKQSRVTGAGDTFMAAHIAAELASQPRTEALQAALNTAARYVAGETVP